MTEAHSPLGGSGAHRWMNCPGSVAMADTMAKMMVALGVEPDADPEYRMEGSAAHVAAAYCLINGLDTYEILGQDFEGVKLEAEMASAVQLYLDTCRDDGPVLPEDVECHIGDNPRTRPHKWFFGTIDRRLYTAERLLITDFKYGAGVVVEPEWNPQMLYYAYGALLQRRDKGVNIRDDREVLLRIVQPRAFHADGTVREWATTAGEVLRWGETELIPAMNRAELDNTLDAGAHCQFCPAKLVCPLMTALFGAAMQADPANIPNLSDEALGRSYQYLPAVEKYIRVMGEEIFKRSLAGRAIPGTKLVSKRSKRVYKEGADTLAREQFGDDAMKQPEVQSPAELEKLGQSAKDFVKEHCYFPHTGLTVALATDKREAVKVEQTSAVFGAAVAAILGSETP